MLYLFFIPSDALSSTSKTTIKYVDTYTGTNVYTYGDILCAILLEKSSYHTVVPFCNSAKSIVFYPIYSGGSNVMTLLKSSNYQIRVYYI